MKTFEELDLIDQVQRALVEVKYETPTPIQAQTVPSALLGRDVLGCAQTGTGKTAAFALPILNRLGKQNRKSIPNSPHVLVLAPTRELAIQIAGSFATYGRHLRVKQALVYGGVSQVNQVRVLKRGAHVLVATPGRLLDLMNQGHISLGRLEVFVLDEADRMLDMGFLPDLKRIIAALPERRQSLFFSATLPPKIVQLSRRLLRDPVNIDVTPGATSIDKIEQRVLFVEQSRKKAVLEQLLRSDGVDLGWNYTMFLHPLPPVLLAELRRKDLVIVPELNYQGQLASVLRSLGVKAEAITQYTGLPFNATELAERIRSMVVPATEGKQAVKA